MDEDTKEKARDRNRLYYFRKSRNTYLKSKYGITIDQYEKRLEKQGGRCAICKSMDAKNSRSKYNVFSVDHNHTTGIVRGLLCMPCNLILVPAVEYYDYSLFQVTFDYLKNNL